MTAHPQPPHHRFTLRGHQGQLSLHVDASLTAPWTVLFGPSGSGKSTILRALAGLTPNVQVTFERCTPDTQAWVALHQQPAHRRRLAYDPQQAPLFPHLTVADNIRFAESLRPVPNSTSLLTEITALLQLAPLLAKRPQQLSGGERQRVSLARALAVPDAQLLLLDEPFAGLDRALRDDLLPRLRDHLQARRLPVLSVTHDPDEALLLQAEVLRVHNGQLTAQGPAPQVLTDEITRLATILSANPNPEP